MQPISILIIYPHWHPANLAGVHRPRLIGNFLSKFNCDVRALTVRSEYFEPPLDLDFEKTFSKDIQVTRVGALPLTKPRIIGDIGLRAIYHLYMGALEILTKEKFDFIWLPIPSFYNAVLGRLLYDKTKTPYGIDYIDPWVRDLTNQRNIRSKLTQYLAHWLEPFALKKVSVISGVATSYYELAIRRNFPEFYENGKLMESTLNPHTGKKMIHVAMPYGFDPGDHQVKLTDIEAPWSSEVNQRIWLYAGAFLPNSHLLLEEMFRAISEIRSEGKWQSDIRLWFIGTGEYSAKSILQYAKDYSLEDIVFEKRERYPFLHILNWLSEADTVMIIGSTEKHYTASKTFQALLSKKPIFCVFHKDSSALDIMSKCNANDYAVNYCPKESSRLLGQKYKKALLKRLSRKDWNVDLKPLQRFSAEVSAKQLYVAIKRVL